MKMINLILIFSAINWFITADLVMIGRFQVINSTWMVVFKPHVS